MLLMAPHGIAVVADGMGGHPGGDVAAGLAVAATAEALEGAAGPKEDGFIDWARSVMRDGILAAQAVLLERGEQQPELRGMGTTLTAMVMDPTAGAWVIGHVGDSRAYRIRGTTLDQLTRDDTWLQQQIDRDASINRAAARHSPYGHILTQCLGLERPPQPQILSGYAAPGDLFLLCSDGLTGMVEDDVILSIVLDADLDNGSDPQIPVRQLVDAANHAGGRDNVTVVLVAFEHA